MTVAFLLCVLLRSFGFSAECLGQHAGAPQTADLGDGNGSGQSSPRGPTRIWLIITNIVLSSVNETGVIRLNYGDAQLGACKETIQGGNHFRYWIQNGPQGNRCDTALSVSICEPED